MTLQLASGWFRLELEKVGAYLEQGRTRLAEINATAWRFPGKHGATRKRQPVPLEIRSLARQALQTAKGPDIALLQRALYADTLLGWEIRRVEYLALKLAAKAPPTNIAFYRKSSPQHEERTGI